MDKRITVGILGLAILAITSGSAGAAFETHTFALLGNGSFMDSPPRFSGDIIQGTLAPGTFWIEFDDTGWPTDNPGTPENERWDYIFSHYFTYDNSTGAEGWDGRFPPFGSGEPSPEWRFFTTAGDTLGGLCTAFVVSMRDLNADEILDWGEFALKEISMNMVAYINFGGGCFHNWCGQGSASGNMNTIDEETLEEELYVPSATSASGRLYLKDDGCNVGTESATWGRIKSIYR